MHSDRRIHGCVLVTKGDQVVYQAQHGFADKSNQEACVPATRFQLASVSKQFTAAAVLILAESNKLSVDDLLTDWIVDCPQSWNQIRLHHLLTHTSGLGHWMEYPEIDLTMHMPIDELIRTFQRRDTFHPCGTKFHYSSVAYVLLARVVELASGMPYQDFLSNKIFQSIDMADTFVGMPQVHTNVATGYRADATPAPSFELDVVGMGAGDVSATVGDMWRWYRALNSGLVLNRSSRDAMFGRQVIIDANVPDRAYGYGIGTETIQSAIVHSHSGSNAGFRTYAAWLPETDSTVIVLSNCEADADMFDLSAQTRTIPDVIAMAISGNR